MLERSHPLCVVMWTSLRVLIDCTYSANGVAFAFRTSHMSAVSNWPKKNVPPSNEPLKSKPTSTDRKRWMSIMGRRHHTDIARCQRRVVHVVLVVHHGHVAVPALLGQRAGSDVLEQSVAVVQRQRRCAARDVDYEVVSLGPQ